MVSFLLPTKRNWKNYGSKVVDSIFNVSNPRNQHIEILVSSKENPKDSRIKWLLESNKKGDQQYNFLAQSASGDYLAVIVDYGILPRNYLCQIDFLNSVAFKNRWYKITSPSTNQNDVYPYPESTPTYPLVVGDKSLPKFKIISYPFMDRATFNLRLKNRIFHPELSHAGDWFLSFFLTQQNEEPVHEPNVYFNNIPRDIVKSFDPIVKDYTYEENFGQWYKKIYKLIQNYKNGEDYYQDTIQNSLTINLKIKLSGQQTDKLS